MKTASLYNFLQDGIIRAALPANFNAVRFSEMYASEAVAGMSHDDTAEAEAITIECGLSQVRLRDDHDEVPSDIDTCQ